jgi:hypothetical protein
MNKNKNAPDTSQRNGAIYFPTFNMFLDELPVTRVNKSGRIYEDIVIDFTVSFYVARDNSKNYKDATRSRINYTFVNGVHVGKASSYPNYYSPLGFTTAKPTTFTTLVGNMLNNSRGEIKLDYFANVANNKKIYLTTEGIKMINGYSHLLIVPPKDGVFNNTGSQSDTNFDFGYIEVSKHIPGSDPKVIKKSLWNLLNNL